MKVGINATCLNDRPSGAQQRFVGIYSQVFSQMSDNKFFVYEPVDCRIRDLFDNFDNVTYIKTKLHSEHRYRRFIKGILYWKKVCNVENFDVFETFSLPVVFCNNSTQLILTIHDIRSIVFEKNFLLKGIYKFVYIVSIKYANRVVTVSKTMKNELQSIFHDAQISVVYNGISTDKTFFNHKKISLFSDVSLPEKYILAVGHFEDRKNYKTLLDALAILHSNGLKKHLVIIGNNSGQMETIVQKSELLGIKDFVHIRNYVSDEKLQLIYLNADLFVFPSIYEGFGIPILEAMKFHIPFVVSDIPVFREIIGSKGVYFNCMDAHSIANTIHDTLGSKKIMDSLVSIGANRVEDFSFKNASTDLMNIYNKITLS